jgi:hypothetical protein
MVPWLNGSYLGLKGGNIRSTVLRGLQMSNAEFFVIMAQYNTLLWPVTILTIILGLIAVFFAFKKTNYSDQLISLILTFLWLWVGIVFGLVFYGSWNANVFGVLFPGFGYFYAVLFSLQGLILLYFGVYRKTFSFKYATNIYSVIGLILILFSLVFYGFVGFVTGYPYPFYPLFGTAPCPVAIFTIGLFSLADKRISPFILILPTVYGVMGVIPVLAFGIYADIGLIISGIFGLFLIYKHWKWPADIAE